MQDQRTWRNVLIDPLFQFRFAAYTLLMIFLGCALVGAYSSHMLTDLHEELVAASSVPEATRLALESGLNGFLAGLLGILVLFIVGATTYLLVQTHRIAGAKYALSRHVRERLMHGDFDARVQLRTQDYLHDLAEDLNALSGHLAKKSKS